MFKLYEYLDTINSPYEVFQVDTTKGNFPVRKHWHYFLEMLYIYEGTLEAVCDGKHYTLHQGDFLFCHSQSIHEFYCSKDQQAIYGVIQCDLNALNFNSSYVPKLRALLQEAKKFEAASVHFTKEKTDEMHMQYVFDSCIRERHNNMYAYDTMLNIYISHILVNILREWLKSGFDPQKIESVEDDESGLENVIEYIDTHSSESLRVQELAKMCNMSYSYFAKCFRDYYGMSCKEYIEYVRLNKAEDLVLFTNYDLNYISQEVGYSDCSHFIKEYKRKLGITPKQHRMKVRGQVSSKDSQTE